MHSSAFCRWHHHPQHVAPTLGDKGNTTIISCNIWTVITRMNFLKPKGIYLMGPGDHLPASHLSRLTPSSAKLFYIPLKSLQTGARVRHTPLLGPGLLVLQVPVPAEDLGKVSVMPHNATAVGAQVPASQVCQWDKWRVPICVQKHQEQGLGSRNSR